METTQSYPNYNNNAASSSSTSSKTFNANAAPFEPQPRKVRPVLQHPLLAAQVRGGLAQPSPTNYYAGTYANQSENLRNHYNNSPDAVRSVGADTALDLENVKLLAGMRELTPGLERKNHQSINKQQSSSSAGLTVIDKLVSQGLKDSTNSSILQKSSNATSKKSKEDDDLTAAMMLELQEEQNLIEVQEVQQNKAEDMRSVFGFSQIFDTSFITTKKENNNLPSNNNSRPDSARNVGASNSVERPFRERNLEDDTNSLGTNMDQTSGAANEVLKQLEEEKRKFEELRKRAEIEDEARRKEAEERDRKHEEQMAEMRAMMTALQAEKEKK